MKTRFAILTGILLCLIPCMARANNFGQTAVMSLCPQGSQEAEEIYQEARKRWLGQAGYKKNPEKAEELFEKAMFMGNSKAPLGIGGIYMWDYRDKYQEEKRLEFMIRMYNEGIKMGCAEGHVLLAECYSKGWGVERNYNRALEELKQGVAKGSPKAMEFYGTHFIENTSEKEKGRELLRKSMGLKNGDAGVALAMSYLEEDDDRAYAALRNGAKLGSLNSLGWLSYYYLQGIHGQKANSKLSECVENIEKEIDWFYTPEPIENFDELCPHPTPLHVTP